MSPIKEVYRGRWAIECLNSGQNPVAVVRPGDKKDNQVDGNLVSAYCNRDDKGGHLQVSGAFIEVSPINPGIIKTEHAEKVAWSVPLEPGVTYEVKKFKDVVLSVTVIHEEEGGDDELHDDPVPIRPRPPLRELEVEVPLPAA